jgi:hypothetical protein
VRAGGLRKYEENNVNKQAGIWIDHRAAFIVVETSDKMTNPQIVATVQQFYQ